MNGTPARMARVRPWLQTTLLWLILLIPVTVKAETPFVLLSDSDGSYNGMLNALTEQHNGTLESEVLTDEAPSGHPFTLAVGSRACEAIIASIASDERALCVFLPSQTFADLTATPKGQRLVAEHRLSAIYLDQPLLRQMLLAQMLKPRMQTIGTVLGPGSDRQATLFSETAYALGLTPLIGRLEDSENPVRELTPIIEESDVFLPLPDSSVFNRASAKWILYLTLRNRVPLVGFSASYAYAGAVVAVHSNVEQIAQQATEILNHRVAGDPLPEPAYPDDFSITVNQTAARNLGLTLAPTDTMVMELKRRERASQ